MVTLAEKESEEEKATAPTPKRLSDVRSSHSVRNPRLALLTLKTMLETDAMYRCIYVQYWLSTLLSNWLHPIQTTYHFVVRI